MKQSQRTPPNPSGFCMCGCGAPAPIARKTHRVRGHIKGHPVRFLPGHNNNPITDSPPNPTGLCMCGCGRPTSLAKGGKRSRGHVEGEHVRYLPGHNVRGSKRSQEARRRTSETLLARGDLISDDAGYNAIHMWINRHYPKTGVCEECGVAARTDFAFLHHPARHTRSREDYAELCKSCHWRFDEPITRRTTGRSAGSR